MGRLRTRFSRKLHVAFSAMLLITLALAWYFLDSVKWYEYDVQRIALANQILEAYEEVSNLTFRELNALGEKLVRGSGDSAADREATVNLLRNAVTHVRQGIAAELAFDQDASDVQKLEALEEIERVVEEVIRAGGVIHEALGAGRASDAATELDRLRSSGITGHFDNLIAVELQQHRLEARIASEEAITLAHYITGVLPIFMTVLVLLTLVTVMLFSRSLTRSVNALQDGVRAFTGGDLVHRIPPLKEAEFVRLGEAFNTMAKELSDHRARMKDANVRLEAMVEERTGELREMNRKLAQLDANRRKLLADISHELRTPLTVIKGESEISLRGQGKTQADYEESFRRIVDQADHTTRLVDDLLFIARADSGEPRLKLRSVPLASLLQSVCADFTTQGEANDISIDLACDDDKAVVLGDPGRLRQVFTILMDNALRYSNPGGNIEVGLARVEPDICVSFRDHGIGLTEEEARQAFERFYRGTSAERHARGTGLGLPVARAIVNAHKGSITLEGKVGEGATATVTLPARDRLRVVA
jgi:two-component system OmpR family sensor kinase